MEVMLKCTFMVNTYIFLIFSIKWFIIKKDGSSFDTILTLIKYIIEFLDENSFYASAEDSSKADLYENSIFNEIGSGVKGYLDGDLKDAKFNRPRQMKIDNEGNLLILDIAGTSSNSIN